MTDATSADPSKKARAAAPEQEEPPVPDLTGSGLTPEDLYFAEDGYFPPEDPLTESGPDHAKDESVAPRSSGGSGGDLLTTYFNSIRDYPLLTPQEELEIARLCREGDKKAFERMVTSNLRLVVRIARDYRNRGVPMLDLIEEGNLGLIHAVRKFDPERGFRFSTYATWWIRQRIEQAVLSQGRLVRLPVHIIKEINNLLRVRQELQGGRQDRSVSVAEIAQAARKDPDYVRQMLALIENLSPVDNSVRNNDDDKGLTLLDILPDNAALSPADVVGQAELGTIIEQWYESLNDKQRQVVLYRFGLKGNEIITLEELGEKVNLTRERVRQIQNEVLKSLRRFFEHYGVTERDNPEGSEL
ncbi:MAG: sigma-70 family RNA polymerase sigma factor [Succinivibrio sp.]|nr:sigma-70 family RNA polymerase sigma factor [Succinivibrio sp.]